MTLFILKETRAARTSRILKVSNELEENGSNTNNFWEKMENNTLKWYGHVLRMEDNGWAKRIMTWSQEGRRRKEDPK
jgi:hypothetical protein